MDTWTTTRADRHDLAACGMCGAQTGTDCRPGGFNHTGRRWSLCITARGTRFGSDTPITIEGPCRATIESTYAYDWTTPNTRHNEPATRTAIVYRGACLGCGWVGPAHHNDENAAVADAHDHTLPRWRDLPIVSLPHHDANETARTTWAGEVAKIYTAYGFNDDYWPSNGGLIRTRRTPGGTRSCYRNGFYDICAETIDAAATTPPRPATPPIQAALF